MSNPEPNYSTRWKPGQSGNPGGSVKGVVKVSNALARLLRTPVSEEFPIKTRADQVASRLFKSCLEGDTMATKEVLNRTEGAVKQSLDISAQQIPTSEIETRLLEALQSAGVDELGARRVLLQLTEGDE